MSDYVIVNGELKHYGVLGMKWGVRKGRINQAYRKALNKKMRLEFNYVNYLDKSERDFAKSGKMYLTEFGKARNAKSLRNSARNMAKAKRYEKKAKKWVKAMSKTFTEKNISQINDKLNKKGAAYMAKADNLIIKGDGSIVDKITMEQKNIYKKKSDKLNRQIMLNNATKNTMDQQDFHVYDPRERKKRK